ELFDFYGLSDIFGACAAQCEVHDGLHIAEDHILVETIDLQTGEVLKPGERGELVYTTLRKRARPMIRFRTGDIGRIDTTPCKCGRTHGRIYVDGRKDDMFIVSAVNVYPSDIEYVIRGLEEVTGEYTVRIYEKDFTCKYEVTVENAGKITDEATARKVSDALKARCGVKPANVIVLPDGSLERSTHKAKRIIDERKQS
ncbi:MAG: phenylacetate--CoA ligase family protein, partial [Oscillospiraceae bacterium]|nr:phenylacetate--CoA ligase family protein [Oscillospiraceae bacterium]